MTTVFGALQLDHNQLSASVEAKQVDAPTAVLPSAKFLAQNHGIWHEDIDPIAEKPLYVNGGVKPGHVAEQKWATLVR